MVGCSLPSSRGAHSRALPHGLFKSASSTSSSYLVCKSASPQDFKLPSNPNPSPTALFKLSRSIVLLTIVKPFKPFLWSAKSPKKKAGVVEQDTRGPIEDDFAAIAIVTVTTTAMKTSIVRGRSRSPAHLPIRPTTGQNKKTVARIRKIAEDLKEKSTFAFKEKTGLYKNTIFQMAVNAMWFAKCKDDGPHLPDLFGPRLRFGCT
ncbi:hypothetical protein DFH07DRAFT_1067417 [Mycena maculata]|uniref:DUF6532 domain-containing protein n=1 Tax=Mycena maculata TaxID=230809 RepID=A0AAD7MLC3_9AGAR|nr:hypothetical protein DFH07DRAFT_1067417 [Mycena maculata]